MGTRFLYSIPLLALALASARCGGKTAGPEVVGDAAPPAKDAAPPAKDAAPRAHDAFTTPDVGTVRPDTGAPCPSQTGLIKLGASCDWGGTCKVDVDVCDGIELPCVCEGGVVAIEPGVDYGCVVASDAGEGPPPTCGEPGQRCDPDAGLTCCPAFSCYAPSGSLARCVATNK